MLKFNLKGKETLSVPFLLWFLSSLFLPVKSDKLGIGSTLYCYKCVSTQPGCGEPFNWLWYWSQACPEKDDVCVKLIQKKGENEVITRDCLSSFRGVETNIPSDHYEGCRPAVRDVKLANFVFNDIKELDIKRDYYTNTTWCFCFFDNRCNSSTLLKSSLLTFFVLIFSLIT